MSSLYSTSNSISQAFLPTHGMRFQGAGDARVHDWAPAKGAGATAATANTALRQRNADTALSNYPTTTSTGGATANGTIAGGLLRPGSIDQTQFKAMLAAAQSGAPGASGMATSPLPAAPSTGLLPLAPNAALAAQGLRPTSADALSMQGANAAAGVGGGIQNLTPAQFAALTGGATLPGSNAMAASAGGLPPTASMPTASMPTGAMPTASMPTGAMPAPAAAMAAASTAASAQTASVPPAGGVDTLTMSDAAIPPDGSQPPTPSAEDGTPIGSFDKNGVLVLNQAPDRDTRKEYVEKGIKWRLVDNPESNKLFFGPDGKLGWKDVLDLVNPLQHIPLVNIAYRHFTGDQPSGAAELLGALPFGPFSTMTAIADLAVRSTTGKDIGENVIAMVTGGDKTTNPATDATTLAQAGNKPAETTSDQVAEVTLDQLQQRLHDDK